MRGSLYRLGVLTGTAVLFLTVLGALTGPASAHGSASSGEHEFTIGFGTEPAYQGFPNSAQVIITHHDGEPVTKLEGELQVEVTYGDESTTIPLEPNFLPGVYGEEGDYRAWFVPSRAGQYTFRIFGELAGKRVNEELTSGPKTFSDVLDTGAESFPVQDPTTGELAERLDREVPRLNQEIVASSTSTSDEVSSARTLAIVGIVVGVLGLIVGGIALAASRKSGTA
ncbi:MAG: hypothetical protein WD206_00605 [Actinomycetota bacterium]